jgi:hypothetical protein
MSQVLYLASTLPVNNNGKGKTYDPAEAARWQAAQVSAISLTNFAGRIAIGTYPSSDFVSYFHSTPLLLPYTLTSSLALLHSLTHTPQA